MSVKNAYKIVLGPKLIPELIMMLIGAVTLQCSYTHIKEDSFERVHRFGHGHLIKVARRMNEMRRDSGARSYR